MKKGIQPFCQWLGINDVVTLDVVYFEGKNVFKTEFVGYDEISINTYNNPRSVRVFLKNNAAPIEDGEQWNCRITGLSTDSRVTADKRQKVFISVDAVERLEQRDIVFNKNEGTAVVITSSGKRELSRGIIPAIEKAEQFKRGDLVYSTKKVYSTAGELLFSFPPIFISSVRGYITRLVNNGVSAVVAQKALKSMPRAV